MSGYEPGTVAVATVRGVKDVRVMRRDRGDELGDWASRAAVAAWLAHDDCDVTDVRPLVVLDNEFDRTLVKHLRTAFAQNPALTTLDWLAHQIESQTRPPKPPEPTGLGAVVKDREGHVWVRIHESYGDLLWRMEVPNTCAEPYDRIDAVEVLSEGVVQP